MGENPSPDTVLGPAGGQQLLGALPYGRVTCADPPSVLRGAPLARTRGCASLSLASARVLGWQTPVPRNRGGGERKTTWVRPMQGFRLAGRKLRCRLTCMGLDQHFYKMICFFFFPFNWF